MAKNSDSPFEEEFTPAEEAALTDATAVPPAEEEGEATVEQAIADAAAGKATEAEPAATPALTDPAAPVDPAAAPVDPAAAPAAPEALTEEQELAAFLEKHAGKTPEELGKLLYQQTKRATKEAATNRQVRSSVSAIAERARAAAERREQVAKVAPNLKENFRKRVTEDPDAAVAELFDALIDQQVTVADTEAEALRFDEAIAFADEHIPNFGGAWPSMKGLANEVGYTDEELNGISDGRSLVMLYLADHTARLMKAGIMDNRGNIDLSKLQPATAEPTDPRLTAPNPQPTLGGGRGSGAVAQTLEQQLAAIADMTEDELGKFDAANPGLIDELLQKAAA